MRENCVFHLESSHLLSLILFACFNEEKADHVCIRSLCFANTTKQQHEEKDLLALGEMACFAVSIKLIVLTTMQIQYSDTSVEVIYCSIYSLNFPSNISSSTNIAL